MGWRMVMAIAGAFVAGCATAQEEDTASAPSIVDFFQRDTPQLVLGDSVALTWVSLPGCSAIGEVVLNTPDDVARLRQFPQCAGVPADLDLSNRTIVGASTRRDCSGFSFLRAYRVESESLIRVVETWRDGGSRAMCGGPFRWLAMAKLPPGWRVEFSRRRIDRENWE